MGELALCEGGLPAGRLLCREEGLYLVFAAWTAKGRGVRKVILRGEGGGSLTLGTLAPEGSGWSLQRRIPRRELERAGLSGRLWGEIRGEGEGPARPVPRDPLLRALYESRPDCRWEALAGGWRAWLPWRTGEPFPWLPLFCFAHTRGDGVWFCLNEGGYPEKREEEP